jgi:hypothetical protein
VGGRPRRHLTSEIVDAAQDGRQKIKSKMGRRFESAGALANCRNSCSSDAGGDASATWLLAARLLWNYNSRAKKWGRIAGLRCGT